MFDENRYNIYKNKDGRWRVYDKITRKVTSFPRLLMANKLGRPLMADEDVHHIDENPDNNNLTNLEVINHVKHEKIHTIKYDWQDKIMICPECGKEFLWTIKQQRTRNRKKKGPFCSRRCVGLYGQREQMRRKTQTECA